MIEGERRERERRLSGVLSASTRANGMRFSSRALKRELVSAALRCQKGGAVEAVAAAEKEKEEEGEAEEEEEQGDR